LRTTATGLTQPEAEERARTAGPNEVAQERRQGWFVRLLKIIRNPLVILLATCRRFPSRPATRAPEP
jgi:Mg2+-importing ATPase